MSFHPPNEPSGTDVGDEEPMKTEMVKRRCGLGRILVLSVCLFLVGHAARAQDDAKTGEAGLRKVSEIKAGHPVRKAVLDELRLPVKTVLKREDVLFKVSRLAVMDDWAFVQGVPVQGDGSAMDYRGTLYEEMVKAEMFDDHISALLRKEGDRWFVVVYHIGVTDVSYVAWPAHYGVPAKLLGLPAKGK